MKPESMGPAKTPMGAKLPVDQHPSQMKHEDPTYTARPTTTQTGSTFAVLTSEADHLGLLWRALEPMGVKPDSATAAARWSFAPATPDGVPV